MRGPTLLSLLNIVPVLTATSQNGERTTHQSMLHTAKSLLPQSSSVTVISSAWQETNVVFLAPDYLDSWTQVYTKR